MFLDVEGRQPGDEMTLAANAPADLRVRVQVQSITPLDSLQIIVNGDVVRTVGANSNDRLRVAFDGAVPMPAGGWIAARVLGPHTKYIGDDYAFAHSGPVYVVRGGRRYVKVEDVQFLAQTLDAIWARVERGRWRSAEEREKYRAMVDSGKRVYERILAGGESGRGR